MWWISNSNYNAQPTLHLCNEKSVIFVQQPVRPHAQLALGNQNSVRQRIALLLSINFLCLFVTSNWQTAGHAMCLVSDDIVVVDKSSCAAGAGLPASLTALPCPGAIAYQSLLLHENFSGLLCTFEEINKKNCQLRSRKVPVWHQ